MTRIYTVVGFGSIVVRRQARFLEDRGFIRRRQVRVSSPRRHDPDIMDALAFLAEDALDHGMQLSAMRTVKVHNFHKIDFARHPAGGDFRRQGRGFFLRGPVARRS